MTSRIVNQLQFEWYHTLASFGCLILYCIFHTSASRLVTEIVTEIFVEPTLGLYYKILFIALFLMRVTGGCYNWGADSSFSLAKFDIHNKLRLGDMDAAILLWFSKRKTFRLFLEIIAFYLCFFAVDSFVSDYTLESLFDKRYEIVAKLPSRNNDSVNTYTKTVLSFGFEAYDISHERHMLIREASEMVSYDDIVNRTQCLLLGYVDMNTARDDNNEESTSEDYDDEKEDYDNVDDDDDEEDDDEEEEEDVEEEDEDEEDDQDDQDVCNIKDEGSNTKSKKYNSTTCEAHNEAYLKDEQETENINEYILKRPDFDEIARESQLVSDFFLSRKQYDDDWFFYHQVSKTSYFAIMGNPEAAVVDFKSSLFFYIMCLTLSTIAIYKLDIFFLIM